MKRLLTGIAVVMVSVMALAGCTAAAKPTAPAPSVPAATENGLKFTTGGEQGTYYRFGGVLAGKIAEANGTALNVVSSEGSKANIEALQSGAAKIGFAQSDVLGYAVEGT